MTPEGQTMQTSEVLNRAADLIEERGWTTGDGWVTDNRPQDAPLCLEGGIMAALGLRISKVNGDCRVFEPLVTCPAYRAVNAYLGRDEVDVAPDGIGYTASPLYSWNDHHAGSAEEVIEVLRAAAVIEAAKENSDTREPVTA